MGAVSRTLEISLADCEISSSTQVKNCACVPCMAEQTGVHGVIFHANAATCMPDHALELFVPALMLLRACAVHARCAHARRWQRMGNKRIPTAPNQLLTGILASIMHSLCLFRRNPADNAACAPRCTAAQPCRPAPSMPLTAKIWIFPKSKTVRS